MSPVPVAGDPPPTAAPLPARLETTASLWSGGVCDTPPNRPRQLSFKGSFSMGACKGQGTIVRVAIANIGGQDATVTLNGLASMRVLPSPSGAPVPATGFGLTMSNPIGSGVSTSMVQKIEGGLGLTVGGGQSFDLLILFPKAAAGDRVRVGAAPAAVISR